MLSVTNGCSEVGRRRVQLAGQRSLRFGLARAASAPDEGDGMAGEDSARRNGLMKSAVDEFLDRTRALVDVLGLLGRGARGALPERVTPVVSQLLVSLQQLIDQVPPLTAELDIVLGEVHAKRLSLQALQAELAAFDRQLEVLEKSLAPLENWAHQSARLRGSLTETLNAVAPDRSSPAG